MLEFANVFVGNTANDGTGTPLRNAFEIIDQNFANILAQGNVVGAVTSVAGRTGPVTLTVNDVTGAASISYVNSLVGAAETYSNSNVAAYLPTDPTVQAIEANVTAANAAIVTANSAVVSYVNTQITALAGTIANTSNDHNNLNNAITNITTLFANAATQTVEINSINANVTAANAAIVTANSAVVSYVNAQDSILQAEITAANVAIAGVSSAWQANAAVLYSDIQTNNSNEVELSNQITAANAAIVTANSAVVSYVNALVTPIQSNIVTLLNNANNLSGALTNITTLTNDVALINANVTASNVAIASLQSNAATQAAQITAANAAIVTANSAVVSYVNALISPIAANTANILATDYNLAGALNNITTLTNDVVLINANVTAANLAISEIESDLSEINSNITAANAAIVTANTAVVSYVNALIAPIAANTANILATDATLAGAITNITTLTNDVVLINANVTAANAAIVTANSAVVSYINSSLTTIQANVAAANLAIATNSGSITTLNSDVAGLTANLTTGNISIFGNVTGYAIVSTGPSISTTGFFWANGTEYVTSISPTGNITFVGDNISSTDAAGGINFYSNGKIHIESLTGFDSSNPAYWVDIGNLQNYNTGNLGLNFSNGSGFSNTAVFTYDWWDGIASGQTNNSSIKHSTVGLYRGDGVPGSTVTRAYITFDTASAGATPAIAVQANSAVIAAGDIIADGNLYTTGGHLRTTAPIDNVFNLTSTLYMGLGANVLLIGNVNSTITAQGNLAVNSNITAGNILTNNHLFANGVNILTGINSNFTTVNANVTAANAAIATLQNEVYSNANVAAYLPTYSGNVTAGNVLTNNYLYANGTSIFSSISGGTTINNGGSSVSIPVSGGNVLVDVGGVQVASFTQTQMTVVGNVVAANIGLTGNTGHPTNTSTVVAWARVSVGGVAYWTPLYQ